jgi:hypothetical protein
MKLMQSSISIRDTRQQMEDKFSAENVAFHQTKISPPRCRSELLLIVLLRRVAITILAPFLVGGERFLHPIPQNDHPGIHNITFAG